MAKLLLYGDLHIGSLRVDNDKLIQTVNFVNDTAYRLGLDGIINLGDTLDCSGGKRQIINAGTVTLLQQLDFSNHYILRGNHEYNDDGDILSMLDCKLFIDKPIVLFDCLFIPYTKKPDYSVYPKGHFKYVFTHCDYHGGRYDNGHEYKGSSDKILNGVKYTNLVLGHYHVRQQIAKNVQAIGATQSRIKSNNNSPLGLTILNTATDEIDFIENPYSQFELATESMRDVSSSEITETQTEEVLNERQSIIDKISTLAKSDELISEFFKKRGLSSEIINALTKGELPNDF